MPTPLHNHTHASQLDGLAKPDEIAKRCQDNNFGSVAVTDHDHCAGHIEFFKEITKAGLKPLLGVETYQTTGSRHENFGTRSKTDEETGIKEKVDNFHLILIAMNNTGLKNLWAMNSYAHTEGFYYNGRVDWELLEKYNEGLICTSACGLGLLSQSLRSNPYVPEVKHLLNRYLDIFGDRFYIELSTYSEEWQRNLNYHLGATAQEFGIPMVYANDAHYAFPGQYDLHETILCMQYQEKRSQLTEPHHTPDLFIMDEKQIQEAFYYLPQPIVDEVIDNSDDIASRCSVSLPEHRNHIPVFVPDSKWASSRDMIFDLAVEGYEKKIASRGLPDDIYMERFKSELAVIYQANIHDYLLMVQDMIRYAKEDKGYLVGPGRGSIGGSLIGYLIGIHEIDPIRYGLIFERFYNIGRATSMPDIDVDFPTFAREDIKGYLSDKYGSENCSDIGTVSTLQGRAAIQKLGGAMEIPYGDINAIKNIIGKAIQAGQQPKWQGKNGIWELVGDQLQPYVRKHPQLFEWAEYMHKHIFTFGVHASGFVVSDVPLAENFPMRWNAKEKKPVTQWDMRIAEEYGYPKIDVLGLRNLDTLMEYNNILKAHGKPEVDFYDVIRMDEDGELPEEMWEMIDNGLTVGIFQVEDGSFPKWLGKHMKPRNLEELALLTALNRPGPINSGAAHRYIEGRNGNPHPPQHPIFAEIAGDAYGEIIYQEHFINFFRALGYDPKEADNIRAIVGKKKRDEMAKIEPDYTKRFTAMGADKELAEKVWEDLEGFADYAFNKAHSVEYGAISMWTTFAKFQNPAEYVLASIRTLVKEGKKNEVPRYTREAKGRMDIEILPVDLNLSGMESMIQDGAIRYGFTDVKGIGRSAGSWLVANRPFNDYDHIIEKAQENKIQLRNGTMRMAVNAGHVKKLKALLESEGEALLEAEEELLGYALSDDSGSILDEHADEIEDTCALLEDIDSDGVYRVAGIITNIREAKTRNGDPMAWVTIENDGIQQEFTVWNSELERLDFIWRRRQAVIATVKVNPKGKNIITAKALYSKKKNYEQADSLAV